MQSNLSDKMQNNDPLIEKDKNIIATGNIPFTNREQILNNITDSFLTINKYLEIVFVNTPLTLLISKPASELIGKQIPEALPDLYKKINTLISDFIVDQKGGQLEDIFPYYEKWFKINSYPSDNYLDLIIKDTTPDEKFQSLLSELKHALKENSRLEGIINKSPLAVVLIDTNNRIVWANAAFTKISNYSIDESLGKSLSELVYGDETNPQTLKMIQEAVQKRESIRVEVVNYSKTGRKYWLDLRMEPVFNNNELSGYLAFKNDITQKKSDELAIKERNETISKVSFITSHELRHEFSKIMMLINESENPENSYNEIKILFDLLKEPANHINSIISKINDNLKHDPTHLIHLINPSVEEICLIEDDKLTNYINSKMIKKITPSIPVKIYENIDIALETIRVQPTIRRLILLDLNMPRKSGWEFLDACTSLNSASHVVMLTSSIDPRDVEKSKKYKIVEDYICKPLTIGVFQEFAKKYCSS